MSITNENVVFWSECSCGAITIDLDDGSQYSCEKKDVKKYFPNLDFRKLQSKKNGCVWSNCNYCINGWGLDLCSCGSGEKVEECNCGSHTPMQVVNEYDKVCAQNIFTRFASHAKYVEG